MGSVRSISLVADESQDGEFVLSTRFLATKEPSGYRVEPSGNLVLVDLREDILAERQAKWIAFLDHIESTPRDPEFMKERPMNQPPVDRKLLQDE